MTSSEFRRSSDQQIPSLEAHRDMSAVRSDRISSMLIALSVGLYAVFVARSAFRIDGELYFSLFDDAMISMRYARNLADGYGLVWNPGETPVEGFTNLLWTLWMAVLHLLPVPASKVSLGVMISSVVVLGANLWVVYRIALIVTRRSSVASLLTLAIVALYYPLLYWSLRGMEVGLLSLVVNAGILASLRWNQTHDRRMLWAPVVLMAVAMLVRPDGFVPFVAIGIYFVVCWPTRNRLQPVLLFAIPFALVSLLLTAFRVAYYDSAVPNTYYLKVGGVSTLERVQTGVSALAHSGVVHLGIAVFLALLLGRRYREANVLLLAGVILLQCAYSVYVGGDAWEMFDYANRYITIGMPPLLILSVYGFVSFLGEPRTISDGKARSILLLLAFTAGLLVVDLFGGTSAAPSLLGRYSPARFAAGLIALLAFIVLVGTAFLAPFAAARRRLAFSLPPLLLLAQLSGWPAYKWAFHYGGSVADFDNDVAMTRIGVAVNGATREDTRIAVVLAGAIPYFADRPTVDLLGKNDPRIAHMPPRRAFQPGHNKWDYEYSIGELGPDLVLQLFFPTDEDRRTVVAAGYDYLGKGEGYWSEVYVRRGSAGVDRAGLTRLMQLQ